MKTTLLFALVALALAVPPLEAAPTVVYLVRHAEKASAPSADPPLTGPGRIRAVALSVIMAQVHPVAVMHTQFRRTVETAKPTFTALHIPAIHIPRDPDPAPNAQAVAARIMKQFHGQTTLVVGHSDTVPAIIHRLGIAHPPTISESQFNRIFKVTKGMWPWSQTTMVETTYGQ